MSQVADDELRLARQLPEEVSLFESLVMASRFGAELLRVGVDAVAEPIGAALPSTLDRAVAPRALEDLFRRHGCDPAVRDPDVRASRVLPIECVSSNCSNAAR